MKVLLVFSIAYVSVTTAYCQTSDDYFNNGLSKQNLEDHRGAIADYTKAIELDPNHVDAYYNRGVAKLNVEQKNSGCLDLSKAGELGHDLAYDTIRDYCN